MRLLLYVSLGLIAAGSLGMCGTKPPAPQILRFVAGVDTSPKPMTAAEVKAQLNDPWAALVLRQNNFPSNLDRALAALDPPAVGFSRQESFFVSESGHLPTNLKLNRSFRIVVTRAKPADSSPTILFSAPAGDREGFIELMSWDPTKKAFNFYRRPAGTEWVWMGDSQDAFRPATRGKGCFACHVHGVPVQKELRQPWSNWHSQAAQIPSEAIPSEEIRKSPLFQNKSPAERLEPIVRAWVSEGIEAQVAHLMRRDDLPAAPALLRPLFETTTVNLISSANRSTPLVPTPKLTLPSRFFLNFDLFSNVLALNTPLTFASGIKREHYKAALTKFDVRLDDGAGFTQPGDTHFVFLVPEAALEEVELIRQLIVQKVITRHFALSVLAIDFPNPVYSAERTRLHKHVPPTGHIEDGRADLSERTALAIIQAAAATPAGSPERQFVAHWQMAPDALRADLEKRIKEYLKAVEARLTTQAGVEDCTRLAASRRHQFAATLLEEDIPLLLPRTNVLAAPPLRMSADGTVGP